MVRSPYFTADHATFRERTREFLAAEVMPSAAAWDQEGRLPRSLWKSLGEQGLLGLLHPRGAGGGERDLFTSVVFLEELGRTGFGGLRAAISVHAYMATHYLALAGGPGLQRDYLAPAVAGERVAALAITEPGTGADLSGLTTTAERDGDHFVVRGVKTMVSNGTAADFHVVAVRTSPDTGTGPYGTTGLSLLVIDSGLPGLTTTPTPTLGWRAAGTATVAYEDVRVPADRVIGRVDAGFYYLMRGLQLERLVAAVLALGGMDRCLDDTRRCLTERRLSGGTPAERQAPAHRIADLATELAAARQLVHHTAWLYEQGDLPATECSMAKLHTTELACRMADAGLHLQGAQGYLDSSDAARTYRDARAATLAAGPSEVMRDLIGRAVLRSGPDSPAARGGAREGA
ncbi:cyclohexanecarboxyl-CoA dehydrogenase [Streptomyces sp. NRRL B-1140]|uniref:acyl-CoA dehydrogenase family protein n=1 Tax=Streptomyces sp. NRRL B-1140 TaxID=1415549 RepID=UPI0006ADC8D7|nr:acyl-CoA dehydrogenase family protein [Streptomyces sp. NRRL B-1140]KOX04370.1 cyclohexanecarboxyl-CoA dehydrogenase [Streptomyces sp. NRRL B-1140]